MPRIQCPDRQIGFDRVAPSLQPGEDEDLHALPDEGACGTIEELAKRERVHRGYMSRVLRLTLLAPDLVEAILDGRQPEGMRLEDLLEAFPAACAKQRNLH